MNFVKKFSILFVFASALAMTACGGGNSNSMSSDSETESMEADKSGPEYTSAYVCPMHCKGSGSDEAGTCPVCKMDYVANEDHQDSDGHEGHNH